MRKVMLLTLMAMMTPVMLLAQQDGRTCSRAIPMEKNSEQEFTYTVTSASPSSPKEVWFSAMTFDLPLSVYFAPEGGASAPAPDVEMDFSCISGYYENEILCSLFCRTGGSSGLGIEMPYQATLESQTLPDGTFIYYLSLGKRYRDLLLQMGITENLKVVVCVTFKSAGVLRLAPDNFFNNCMDGPKFMQVGDTVQVQEKDKQRHVIVPYVQWQEDTILYTWTGTEPCQLTVANTCDFDPTDNENQDVIQFATIQPNSTLKTLATDIYKWVHNAEFPNQAGMYYAKFYSNSEGVITVKKAEQTPPEADATLLRYDRTYALDANSTAIYAIPRSWTLDVKFTTPTAHLFTMVLATSASFDDEVVLNKYAFSKTEEGRSTAIRGAELQKYWNALPKDKHYLYVRFICTEATTVTPQVWYMSDCYKNAANNSRIVGPNKSITIKKTNVDPYLFSYADWAGGDMTINFAINSDCEVYFADTCGMNINKPNMSYWLMYKAKVKSSSPLKIPAEEIAKWADRIDAEGCFYAIFYTSASSTNRKLTFTTNAPQDADPTYPATTIAVVCEGSKIVVNVSEAQSIVVIDESGAEKAKWDAEPGTPYELNLPPGNYSLAGEKEKISLKL